MAIFVSFHWWRLVLIPPSLSAIIPLSLTSPHFSFAMFVSFHWGRLLLIIPAIIPLPFHSPFSFSWFNLWLRRHSTQHPSLSTPYFLPLSPSLFFSSLLLEQQEEYKRETILALRSALILCYALLSPCGIGLALNVKARNLCTHVQISMKEVTVTVSHVIPS